MQEDFVWKLFHAWTSSDGHVLRDSNQVQASPRANGGWKLLRIFGKCTCNKQTVLSPGIQSALEQPQSFNGTSTSPTTRCKLTMKLPQIDCANKHELRNSPFKDLPLELHLQILSRVDLRDIIAYRKVVNLFRTSLTLLTDAT